MLRQLSGEPGEGGTWVGGEDDAAKVLAPGGGDEKVLEKTRDVIKENARRVYDAPGKGVLWGWEVSAYIWTKAISTGAFLVPFFIHGIGLKPVPSNVQWLAGIVALVFLGLTGGFLVIDLDRPTRFFYVLLRPQWGSWLVKGAYIISGYGLLLVLWMGAKFFEANALADKLGWVAWVFALFTAIYTAFLFAQAKGRDFWQSPLLSLHMLTHAVTSGAAVLLAAALFWDALIPFLGVLSAFLAGGILFHLFALLAELLTSHNTADAHRAVQIIAQGQFKYLFWVGVVVLGNILPLVLLSLSGSVAVAATSAVLALLGIWFSVRVWVTAPQLIPLS
jgi:formate-dependent nitrite reductase membrane component NrfD